MKQTNFEIQSYILKLINKYGKLFIYPFVEFCQVERFPVIDLLSILSLRNV